MAPTQPTHHGRTIDRPAVADMARDFATSIQALGPSDVAREMGLDRTESTIDEVAGAHVDWYDDTREVC